MRPTVSRIVLAFGFAGTICQAQNCPLFGPAYPSVTDVTAPALVAAKAKFDEAIAASPDIDKDKVWFAIEVYSSLSKENATIHRHYNHAPGQNSSLVVGPNTLFRIHSISKVVTVYTMLTKLAYDHWHEPVTKFIPELANSGVLDATSDVDWSEVTVGSLASQISGISRDYGLFDASTSLPSIPGLRKLKESEIVKCASPENGPCTREEAMRLVQQTYPLALSYRTPNYSNMAFQLLAYAVENITGIAFPDLVVQQLIEPLDLQRTYVTYPGNDTDAVVYDGWDLDFGDEAPMGGYYSCLNDLTSLGRSILNSTLLSPITTRKWLRPVSHTSTPSFSMGSPWEIMRPRVAVSSAPATTRNRHVDVYSKQGGGAEYTSLLGIVPDYDMGISILTGGPQSGASFVAIRQLFIDIWLPAMEQAARDQAMANLVGNYTLAAGDGDDAGPPTTASMEIKILNDEPAICMTALVGDGVDIMELLKANTGSLAGLEGEMRVWFYPMGLVEGDGGEGTKIAFRGVAGLEGILPIEDCGSWAEGDRIRWGNYPTDVLIFTLGADGKAKSVELPAMGKPLLRAQE
ncbi:beta-lactamase/transpeptidase-like protein [Chaetomium tenue]|uniref:Beta-lactamase/transpeptidase-like protein n=1 Tax=Chaetomium tenue TaxID=1854479 RepID=A0ACB7P0Q8_9PEZI|nr:beta-lactamase/transpeptidase-like protein [Chaetomium globosum]